MSVFLAGAFGQGNPGDEALLSAFSHALGHLDPVASTCDPAATAAAHDVAAVERDDLAGVGREIARADAVVVAGGTIFKALHPSSGRPPLSLLRRTAALAALTRALRKPLALVGVGAAPLAGRGARALTRAIVRAADLLILRDEESAGHLAAAGAPTPIRVGADAAWTLVPERDEPVAADRPAVLMRASAGRHAPVTIDGAARGGRSAALATNDDAARGGRSAAPPTNDGAARGGRSAAPVAGDERPVVVALSHLAGGPDLASRLADGLRPVVAAGLPVRLDPWQGDGDADLAAAVSTRLGDPRVTVTPPPADLDEARESMAEARLVLAQRFHALVAAAGAGVPALAVAHEPKLEGLARRLEQPAVAADAPPSTLAGEVLRAVDGPPPDPEAIERERASAEEAFRLLRVLLARGRSEEAVDVDGLALRPEEWLG